MKPDDRDAIASNTILQAGDLETLDQFLTKEMARQQIQAFIKGENLDLLINRVIDLAEQQDTQGRLRAAAMLGRIAAVARTRQKQVFGRVHDLRLEPHASIDMLTTSEQKTYASEALGHLEATWVFDFSLDQAALIETADIARRELLSGALARAERVDVWLEALAERSMQTALIESVEPRLRKVRRILTACNEVLVQWKGSVGLRPGHALARCAEDFIPVNIEEPDPELVEGLVDQFFLILARVVELRFSYALDADTYLVIPKLKKRMGRIGWNTYVSNSAAVERVRVNLLEASLVLARQSKTDVEVLSRLQECFSSKQRLAEAISSHFATAKELNPNVQQWWVSGGSVSNPEKESEQRIGNTEDEQIASLLIEVEACQGTIEKLGRAVAPLLEISDPVLASTVRKAVTGFSAIGQISRRLARMRRLEKTQIQGLTIEYNPLEQEMVDGHRTGVRSVRVLREGVKKDFGGAVKTLVKPLVEASK
jgi:hypothetical protein